MEIVYYIATLAYLIFSIYLIIGMSRLPQFLPNQINDSESQSIAVVVCARNEESVIGKLLESIHQQSISHHSYHVYIINDASEDNTLAVIRDFCKLHPQMSCEVISNHQPLGKKTSISKLIPILKEELVLATDADCELEKDVLKNCMAAFQDSKIQLISGPVFLGNNRKYIGGFQDMEFFSLIASGAAFIGNQMPVMCNGANLAYRKSTFLACNPYFGNHLIRSGDDVFLLHSVKKVFGADSIKFALSHSSIVYTQRVDSLKGFINQRIRWGAKAGSYKDIFSLFIAAFVLVIYQLVLFTYLNGIIQWQISAAALLFIVVKFVADFAFLSYSAQRMNKKLNGLSYIYTEILLPFYIVFVGVLSQFMSFSWKGKVYKK